ncbi:helix-turn-helix domain-containing protein [Streptomyces sp. NPDC006879]|uniref:helix-turn-helix domain-containing protein n=1 Tax=Streptomyces sp. NPDC006879 TaxID=3364767 RepID=UPI00369AB66F
MGPGSPRQPWWIDLRPPHPPEEGSAPAGTGAARQGELASARSLAATQSAGARTSPTERKEAAIPARTTALDWSRPDDVLKAHRLAHTGGSAELLDWLARRLGGWTGLVAADGAVQHARQAPPETRIVKLLARGAAEMKARGAGSAVLAGSGKTVLLFDLGGSALAAALDLPHHPGAPALLADAAVPLALALRAERAEAVLQASAVAEGRVREAVLHLLMSGRLSMAHQIAETLAPPLPDPLHLYVVECRTGDRERVGKLIDELTDGRAWTVRCPVYVRHLIALVPVGLSAGRPEAGPLASAIAAAAGDCVVGVSARACLREAPPAYTQAFHAVAVARGRSTRHARFGSGPELAMAAHQPGSPWAHAFLEPLHGYRPRRAQDPDALELRATAHAWLNFTTHATRLLKIHRNTLATRLRHVESLLDLDLNTLPGQASLSLALRLAPADRAAPSPPRATPATMDGVLAHPEVADWARLQLRALTGPDAPPGAGGTLRVWLANDARLVPTAAALGISVPGARKRLTRIEAVLERSLLQTPSARYDLWLAHRSVELATAPLRGEPE